MADIEKTPVITFKTEDSGLLKGVTSVKELKTAIAQLKDEIVRMRQAGEDTTKATTQLQAAQRELNTVMGLTKKGVDGVEGSYDNLVAKLREAKTEWRALPKFINGELNPAWESARQKVEQYNTELKNYDASVGVYTRNVGNYKSALEGFTGTLGQAAQVGGQFTNGLTAMSGIMGIVGADTSDMDDAMKNMRITVGLLQGARGFAGLIKQLGDYIKISVKSTTTTKADTVAKKANTEATTAMAGAETAAAGATTLLGVALKALGIGLIVSALAFVVAHLEDIVKWVTDLGVKLGIIKERNKDQLSLVEQTQKKYEEEKDTLDKQSRIMQAQGKSQKDILKFQIQEITASIKTKEAELASAQATVKRLEAHNWIQRVLNGENKEYKQMKKVVEELTAELKEQKKTLADTQFDLELEGYREATDARKKAQSAADKKASEEAARLAKERAEAWKKSDEAVKKGVEAATKAIQEQETAVQKLDREWKETEKTYENATKETKKRIALYEAAVKVNSSDAASTALLVQETKNLEKLEKGLIYEKEAYYGKRYEAAAAEDYAAIERNVKEIYGWRVKEEEASENLFGYTKDQYGLSISAKKADQERVAILKAQVKAVEDYLRTVEKINPEDYNSKLTRKDYEGMGLKEPAITALLDYFGKSTELKQAEQDALASMLVSFEDAFSKAVEEGNFNTARVLMDNFFFGDEDNMKKLWEEVGIRNAHDYFKSFEKALMDAELEAGEDASMEMFNRFQGHWSEGFGVIRQLEEELERLKKSNGEWAVLEIVAKEEELAKKRLEIFQSIFKQYSNVINKYGVSTGKVLTATGDLWEALLQKQVKNGKKSEEEAKKSFKAVKALQISTAVINTAAAVVQALADTTVPSYYVKAANAIAAGIAGAAEIVKISSTDFSASGSYSASNSTAPTITQTPAMVNTYGINPNDYAEAAAQNPVRVYVLEEDITNAQQAVRTRVSEATF